MKPVWKNIIAIIAGWLGGSIINMGLIQIGHAVLPIEGVDLNDMEAVAAIMPSLEYQYFIFPFLAHALGTLIGAFIAAKIAATKKMLFAYLIGILFLIGGIMINMMLTGPDWFTVTDLALAYLPMAWIGGKLASKSKNKQ